MIIIDDSKTLMTHSTFENRDHTIQNYKLNLLPKEEHGIESFSLIYIFP